MTVNPQKQFFVILLIVFLGFLGISMPYLIFPALFLNPDYDILDENATATAQALYLGVTLAVYPLGQFVGSPILGALSDDYGRKKLLTASLVVSAFFNLLTGFAISKHILWLLIASRFGAGLMEGNIAIARAMATDIKAISKQKTLGKINAAASIAYLIGPFFGGLLTDKNISESFTTATPFYFTSLLLLALTALAGVVLKGQTVTPSKMRSFWTRINLYNRLKNLFKNKTLQLLMILSTCFTIAVDIFYEFGPVFLTLKWDLSPADLIYYNGILCIGLALGNGFLPKYFTNSPSNRQPIILSIFGFSLLLLLMIITEFPYLMLFFFGVSGLVIGLAVTLITVKISDSASDQIQGEVLGVQHSLRVLGDGIICLFGGFLLLVSSKAILVAAAMIALLTMIYSYYRLA
ncbi:MFS transporter [Criblamydia sequanensis]|uniref:Transporter, MFS family n=1 Tax=Candidatus Criblamydia sequanensis CRIB-18 TaxID=1437425 RepID=A0A090E101_9BACT|nr:MFS transporter [Criblamydia sequanensis]CDR34459.1 Transporter, MFS family [Criblamydia sequanensis CRIB-18]